MNPQDALNQLDAVAASVKYSREDHATLQTCTLVLQQVINEHAAFVQAKIDADAAEVKRGQEDSDKPKTRKG